MEFQDDYSDIIHLPHPISAKHPRMPLYNRAAQFAPFAALNGYEEAIVEIARQTVPMHELTEEEIEMISKKLHYLIDSRLKSKVKITYFIPDEHKSGGRYCSIIGCIRLVEESLNQVILTDKRTIPLDRITAVEGDVFDIFEE